MSILYGVRMYERKYQTLAFASPLATDYWRPEWKHRWPTVHPKPRCPLPRDRGGHFRRRRCDVTLRETLPRGTEWCGGQQSPTTSHFPAATASYIRTRRIGDGTRQRPSPSPIIWFKLCIRNIISIYIYIYTFFPTMYRKGIISYKIYEHGGLIYFVFRYDFRLSRLRANIKRILYRKSGIFDARLRRRRQLIAVKTRNAVFGLILKFHIIWYTC